MRRIIWIPVAILIFNSCEKLDKLTQFDIDYETSFTIPGTIGIGLPIDIITPEVQTNSKQEFSGNNTKQELVEEIILKKMKLTITSPTESDFSFLNGIIIYLNAPGLEETKVAWKDPIPESAGNSFDLETSNADLKEYIFHDQFELRVKSKTDEVIDEDHEVKVNTVFRVDAKVLGQ